MGSTPNTLYFSYPITSFRAQSFVLTFPGLSLESEMIGNLSTFILQPPSHLMCKVRAKQCVLGLDSIKSVRSGNAFQSFYNWRNQGRKMGEWLKCVRSMARPANRTTGSRSAAVSETGDGDPQSGLRAVRGSGFARAIGWFGRQAHKQQFTLHTWPGFTIICLQWETFFHISSGRELCRKTLKGRVWEIGGRGISLWGEGASSLCLLINGVCVTSSRGTGLNSWWGKTFKGRSGWKRNSGKGEGGK